MDPIVTVTFEIHEQQFTSCNDDEANRAAILYTTVEFGGTTTRLDPVTYGVDGRGHGTVEAKATMNLIKEVLRLACPNSEFWIQGEANTSPMPGS